MKIEYKKRDICWYNQGLFLDFMWRMLLLLYQS